MRGTLCAIGAAVLLGGCGGGSVTVNRPAGARAGTAHARSRAAAATATTRTAASGTGGTGTAASGTTTASRARPHRPRLTFPDVGRLPQTTALPSTATARFRSEMQALWLGVTTGQAGPAMPAFFPEAAYEQVKALGDDAADWTDRLVVHFRLDVAAAHAALGPGAASARFVEVLVPSQLIQWVAPGACYNTLGYWNVPGSRLVYEEGGQERSIGIASLISWRGYWYVVHLGSEVPPPDSGVVDNPSPGVGVFGPPGGC